MIPIKIFHDDIRQPPPGWVWARTNAEAKELLSSLIFEVEAISLDHDMGLDQLIPGPDTIALAGNSADGSGFDLVQWMIENKKVPPHVSIHSWNPVGARRMSDALNAAGFDCVIEVYVVP